MSGLRTGRGGKDGYLREKISRAYPIDKRNNIIQQRWEGIVTNEQAMLGGPPTNSDT